MISVNEKAMEIVNDMILRKEELKIEVSTLENGTTVIDLGQEVRGSWEAARMMAEILFGGIGQVSFETFPEMIDGVYYPAVNVSVDHAVLSLAGCDISGWELKPGKFAPIVAGPGRTLGRKPGDWMEKYSDYEDKYHQAIITIESKDPVSVEQASELAEACRVQPEDLYLLVAPSSSLACSVQVSARILEQTLHRLMEEGFDLDTIIQAQGFCVIPPCIDNELIAMGRLNDVLIYGGQATYTVCWDDDKIADIVNKITSDKASTYGKPFKEIYLEAGCDFYQVPMEMYSPASVVIVNTKTGKIHKAGKINTEILARSFNDTVSG
ncbi:methenyltetrahydromethanopterin cyclohydrolase [Halothermothrix orenii]|uniref:Methenyltetrahydromethanopterin cyclohydrolase n=1 Tax=Halothermothrix orenii (strain H 168 / OCM 544 / DSM 9562) TaxID=373903 RepID=B8CZF0_HALOH|nr:methenyltetrahydromethanopterin cyclohydrolase [Halothermothrix orenii]ACL70669.1 Methenyltetrahydromethanopterin cyclohydrolase [Halothermothrix orenii H 168]